MAELERLVLSGELFQTSATSSPPRSPSPDAGWHDDELNLSDDGKDYDSDTARRAAFDKHLKEQEKRAESIGMGPGRTGVKGEKTHLGGKTYLEEEREKGVDADGLVLKERERAERRNVFGETRKGRFGHLREVGVKGFLHAVEDELRGTWIVVHLYEPTLARLARVHSDTKFLRARASALGFASTASSSSSRGAPQFKRATREVQDDDDPYDEKDYEDDEEEEEIYDDDVDLDVLPTMLVYRDGELVHNWVRVDWEAGEAGIEELLDRYHILPQSTSHSRNLGLPSDDEDDLIWSDEDV
ncbi:hypothetical protein B0H14DRAFT_2669667 [Mycena olivaceomarginata]|nr:hypothetical protein B0H14DRAFT_2669667 [Mycena olivaceomarginata]